MSNSNNGTLTHLLFSKMSKNCLTLECRRLMIRQKLKLYWLMCFWNRKALKETPGKFTITSDLTHQVTDLCQFKKMKNYSLNIMVTIPIPSIEKKTRQMPNHNLSWVPFK